MLRTFRSGQPGKRYKKRISEAIATLRWHHSWNPRDYTSSLPHLRNMTWHCKECQIPNQDKADKCKKCSQHWSKCWLQGRVRRNSRQRPSSQPKQPKERKDKKTDSDSLQEKGEESWHLFPSKVPWIATSPQTRVTSLREVEHQEEERPLPPAPTLPAPPTGQVPPPDTEPLSEAEQKLIVHLKALQELQELPEPMAMQLAQLEARQLAANTQKALSHGHLNRLHRVRNQTQSLTRKIAALDQEWKQFLIDVQHKVHLHSQHYQRHRGDLLENLNLKIQELETVKREVSTASQALLGQTQEPEAVLEDHEIQMQLQNFQELTATLNSSLEAANSAVHLVSEGEEMEDVTPEDQEEKPARSHLAPAPFRSPGSPGRVSTHVLKQDRTKEKAKEKERDKEKHKSATAYRSEG